MGVVGVHGHTLSGWCDCSKGARLDAGGRCVHGRGELFHTCAWLWAPISSLTGSLSV